MKSTAMGAIGEKLTAAGLDVFSSQFEIMATDAIKAQPHDIVAAWHRLGMTFGHRYLAELSQKLGINNTARAANLISKVPPKVSNAAKVLRRRQQAAKLIQLHFGYKMANGDDLADVRAHEMAAHKRDGALMAELEKELPILSGNMRFAKLGELLSAQQVAEARERAGV